MARPVLALLTDFGVRDHYVGVMKGVALGICPGLTLVDLTHDIPAQDVRAAAFELDASFRYFPSGTVFLAVVDPGVGSDRRAVAVETADYRFVAPDNGLLTPVLNGAGHWRAVTLSNPQYARREISRTFEGRDRFAPAAAWLASGTSLDALGPAVEHLVRLTLPEALTTMDGVRGEIVRVDHFGNLVTNISRRRLHELGNPVVVAAGDRDDLPLVATYADAPAATLCALIGSGDFLELAVSGGNAALVTGLRTGAPVLVRRRA
jgi:S-adenosylmethionine hydrolase